jgi:hypothetical protein
VKVDILYGRRALQPDYAVRMMVDELPQPQPRLQRVLRWLIKLGILSHGTGRY